MGQFRKINDETKVLQGQSRFIKNIPDVKPIEQMWPAPADLKEAGKALWEEQGALLVKARALTDLDRPAFHLLCKTYDAINQADAVLAAHGLTVSGRDGKKSHPAIKARHDATVNFMRLSEKFGLTPYDRNRIDLKVDSEPDDGMRKFLFGRNR